MTDERQPAGKPKFVHQADKIVMTLSPDGLSVDYASFYIALGIACALDPKIATPIKVAIELAGKPDIDKLSPEIAHLVFACAAFFERHNPFEDNPKDQ